MAEIGKDQEFAAAVDRVTSAALTFLDVVGLAEPFARGGRPELAIPLYRIWLQFNPAAPGRHVVAFNLSVLLDRTGRPSEAKTQLEAALETDPDFVEACINLGGIVERSGDLKGAIETWTTGVQRLAGVTGGRLRHKAVLLKQICRVLLSRQLTAAAEPLLVQCLELDPTQKDVMGQLGAARLSLCRAPWLPSDPAGQVEFLQSIQPLSLATHVDDPFFQLGAAHRYVRATVPPPLETGADRRGASTALEGRRMRVGYVSSDLRDHAIGYLLAEIMERHDRKALEVFAYSCGPASASPLTGRLKAAFEHWRDIDGLSDGEAAALIAADQIDVLVDVNGLTKDARTGVFAHRPAPIVVNWLGFPGSMGSPYHHYMLADPFIVPEGNEAYFTEKVVRVGCYQPNDRNRAVAERPSRAEAGLPDGVFVFCCFNGAQKITQSMLGRWLEVLTAVPASVLWLLASTKETEEELRAAAQRSGIGPDRIIFAPKLENARHLARYPLADLFLDTFPYGAHTTASAALFMGVPVLTFPGASFASRVCGSLVSAAGIPEMICASANEYVEAAVNLARNPARLAGVRERLTAAKAGCRLFDMDAMAAELAELYQRLCRDHEAGLTPQPDLTNLELYHEIGAELCSEDEDDGSMTARAAHYRRRLARRDADRPIALDRRLWTADVREEMRTVKTDAGSGDLRPQVKHRRYG